MSRTVKSLLGYLLILILVALVLVSFSCVSMQRAKEGSSAPPAPSAPGMDESAAGGRMAALEKAADQALPASAPPPEGRSGTPPENQLDVNKVRASQMIIWTADYDIRTDSAAQAAKDFRAQVEKLGGFISAQNKQIDESGNTRVTVTARVPSEKFWPAINGLEGIGKVESGNTSSENVTEEWVDLAARLGIKQLRKAQLEALLKRAQSTEELDRRQAQILQVQEEIERIQGRQRLLQNQVALSTINATFYEKGLAPIGKPGPFSVKNTFLRSWYYLLEVLKVLLAVVLFVALPLSVVWVPLLIWYLVRRSKQQPKSL